MSDAVLIFTFSPVQTFIAEARRVSDLRAGSQTLVALARAAGTVLQQHGELVYPANVDASQDAPNKLVALVPWERAEAAVRAAQAALLAEWQRLAGAARERFRRDVGALAPQGDAIWEETWQRQTHTLWEVYWAAAAQDGCPYAEAYEQASRAVEAAKRTRAFAPAEEPGLKDSLSGRRAALHLAGQDARAYWLAASEAAPPARLRPGGRERLDALGVIKRFSPLAEGARLASTSTVASADFLARARPHLAAYRSAVEALHPYKVRGDPDWPYDGDLLYRETLTPARLQDSYGLQQPDDSALERAREALHHLSREAGGPPSPYYAVLVLDGDDMGARVADGARGGPAAHRRLSERLAAFAAGALAAMTPYEAQPVYAGGDDVLLLVPLARALPLAQVLAQQFFEVTGCTASAGLAIAHHLYPLDATLQAARAAEQRAKLVRGKAAVGVRVVRRSGETTDLRSPWAAMGDTFSALVELFREDRDGPPLSGRFAYEVVGIAAALPAADARLEGELRRLLGRHRQAGHPRAPAPDEWATRLRAWAAALGETTAQEPDGHDPAGAPSEPAAAREATSELGRWLVFARFVAAGGRD